MTTDDQLDARLRAAGERWRGVNSAAATVDPAAMVDAGAVAPEELADPHDLTPERRPAKRRTWIAAAAGVAAVAATVAIAVGLGGNDHPKPAGTANALTGRTWQLVSYDYQSPQGRRTMGAKGTGEGPPFAVTSPATVRFAGGRVSGSDGCNTFGGTARVSGAQIRIGNVATTDIGCLDPEVGAVAVAVQQLLSGTLTWSVTEDQLTLSRAGVGTFEFRARPAPTTDPSALVGIGWTVTTIEHGTTPNSSASSVTVTALVTFTSTTYTVSHRCYLQAGQVSFNGSQASFSNSHNVPHSCPYIADPGGTDAAEDKLVDSVLTGETTWALDGDALTITHAGVGALILQRADIDPGFTGKSGSGSPSSPPTK